MIKRETVTSLLVGFMVGACGIAPVVAGDGLGNFGPAQGGGGVTDAELTAIGALTPTDGNVIVGDGSTWVAESGATARTSLGALGGSLGSTDNAILTADGTGGATAQGTTATLDAGVLTLPAGGSVNATTTGFFALGTGADDPRLVKTATDRMAVQDGGGNAGRFTVGAGAVSAVALGINGQVDTGLFSGATNRFGAASGGNSVAEFRSTGFSAGSAMKLGWDSTTSPAGGTADTALSRDAAGRVLVEDGAGTAATLRAAGVVYGPATTSGVKLTGSGTTLLLQLGDGTPSGNLSSSSGVATFANFNAGAGSLSNCALRLNSDTNTGLFGTADSNVSVAVGGTQIAAVGTLGVTRRVYPEAVTGNYTLANAQSDQVLTNTGAGGALEIELGSITATGFAITVVATDNQDITLDPGSSDKFVGLAGGWADGEAMLVDDQNDAVRLVRLSTGDWLVEWTRGTLTEETP